MSTLHPGKVTDAIRKLRDAALREMDATPSGEKKAEGVKFDHSHAATPAPAIRSQEDFDTQNGVAMFPGVHSPHIGNGSGGVR